MYFKRTTKTLLNTRTITSNIDTIPWDECNKIWLEAANQAEQNALEALHALADRQHNRLRRDALRLAGIDETEASYEGDLGIEAPTPHLDGEARKEIRRKSGNEAVREYFIKPYQLKGWGPKLLDQILAKYSTHKLNSLGSEGTISGMEYLRQNIDPQDPHQMGIYRFLMLDTRSDYLEKMGSGDNKKYCTLVPLILYAHKLYNDVPYSRWERETLEYVVNPALCEAMLTEVPELSHERILELREIGLMQAGTRRNPQTTYSLYRLGETELGNANALVKIMVCQTWAAHPTNRTKYMVLDPMNWDSMPPPLLDANIFKAPPPAPQPKPVLAATTNPWD